MNFAGASAQHVTFAYEDEIILKSIREACKTRTVVLVSHRKSTMNVADEVYEMENGRVS